jgi:hypothetical protein
MPEEISMMTSRIEEEQQENLYSQFESVKNKINDSKPTLTLVNLKFLDENVTISNSSNSVDKTPATIENPKNFNTCIFFNQYFSSR